MCSSNNLETESLQGFWLKIGREEGRAEGLKEGYEKGLKVNFSILKELPDDGKAEEAKRVLSDSDYRERLCREYLSEQE